MGQYKVPQNVEAEDKILGPLTLKQFIYAVIGIGYGFLTFTIFKAVLPLFFLIGLPPTIFMLALGLYQREDQPFETYFLGVMSFLTRPRHRFWEKEPIAEVFRVEPPPPQPEMVTRDPREVRGQLGRLAQLVDTRGWSAKQPELQEPEEAPLVDLHDRIGSEQFTSQQPAAVEPVEVTAQDDILDTQHNPNAANLNTLIENTVKNVRQEALDKMKHPPKATAKPKAAATKNASVQPTTSGMTATSTPDILKLAAEGGDLTVAQIAAQAARRQEQALTEGQTVSLRPGPQGN